MESEISTAQLPSSHPSEQPKTRGCLNPHTNISATTSPLDRPTSPSFTLPQDRSVQTVCGGNHGAAATVNRFCVSAFTPPFLEWQGQPGLAQGEEEEWEITRIVGKRQTGRGYEYKVRWKNTWLPSSELGNAQELLQEFEAKRQALR